MNNEQRLINETYQRLNKQMYANFLKCIKFMKIDLQIRKMIME